jgi:glycosyltransferase involved in cell wall biosynthesis
MPFGWHAWAFAGAALAGRGRAIVHIGNHPMDESGARRLVFRALVLAGRPFTQAYVCCSHHVAAGVERVFGLSAKRLRVVPNGVIVPALRSRTLPKDGEFRIGMVATLEAHKDHATLLRAFPALIAGVTKRGLRPHLLLAGEGSLERCLRDLAESLGIAQQVTFLGTVSDVPGLLDRLDAFVFSTTEAEGQGIAMLEAMAAGVPIAASDVGACREVLDGGHAGLLFTAGDPAALVGAVVGMLDDPDAVEARRRYAHRKVAEVFDVARTARAYAELAGLA